MPTVFVTVDTALNRLASIAPADRVLVHAAAGGVGLAAMQVIAAAGATAVTTAGSPSKRALLRNLGSAHVSSSRDTAFVTELTEVGGASVALNTLTSSGMVAGSLATLKWGGSFVEISKRDIKSAARVAQGRWLIWLSNVASFRAVLRACCLHSSRSSSPFQPQSAPTSTTLCWRLTLCRRLPCMLP